MFKLKLDAELILASGSPRRKELLGACGLPFTVKVSQVPEDVLAGEGAAEMVERLALAKCQAVAEQFPSSWVIGADTTVLIDGEILGKPESEEHAFQMISKIQGRRHEVWSAFSIMQKSGNRKVSKAGQSFVELMPLSEKAIRSYIASGEPMDKAGAYAIQDLGAHFIKRVEGSYSNVVGLDIAAVIYELLNLDVIAYV